MGLAGWLQDTNRTGRFVVLAQAAIWPGAHEGSTIQQMLREDRARNLPVLDLQRYLGGLESDLEAMPPEVVLGRVRRFLTVDLREVRGLRHVGFACGLAHRFPRLGLRLSRLPLVPA